ncbi:hypothetical protein [Stutzerimonas xanthomarina]|uniref:hypothetical protein n=1 Tax=Stutzerimonas xanthomarina TaxID=271420 RepID=UPI003AA8C2B7
MSYSSFEFVTKMVDAGEFKIFMSTRDTLIRAFMAGPSLRWQQSLPSPSPFKPVRPW